MKELFGNFFEERESAKNQILKLSEQLPIIIKNLAIDGGVMQIGTLDYLEDVLDEIFEQDVLGKGRKRLSIYPTFKRV